MTLTPGTLLQLFADTATAVHDAVRAIPHASRRDRTDVPGQYALDLVADAAACAVLAPAGVRIVSEESGVTEHAGAEITVVIDPIDGSTNCSRGIAYWCTSLCALDADGPVAALVANHPTGSRTTAIRGGGAFRDGVGLHPSTATRLDQSVIGFGGFPPRPMRSKQSRILGSIALELCDVAAGGLDGYLDGGLYVAPWDYLGGYLVCLEAGAVVRDATGQPLVVDDIDARRQVVAAGTEELAAVLEAHVA